MYWYEAWNKQLLKLLFLFIFHYRTLNWAYRNAHVWVIGSFMDNYWILNWKEPLVIYLKGNVSSFMQSLWKDTRKHNKNLGEFAKLQSWSICSVVSVLLIATTRFHLHEMPWNLIFEYFSNICGEKLSSF